MSAFSSFHPKEAVRVRVKKYDDLLPPEYRRFSVDPQITSFEVLHSLVSRAFDIKGEFFMRYLTKGDNGKETYLPLLSDWDLNAAFLESSTPCLELKVEHKCYGENFTYKDIEDLKLTYGLSEDDHTRNTPGLALDRTSISGTILNQMEKTLNMMQRAFNISESDNEVDYFKSIKQPMLISEFHSYLDSDGCLVKPQEMRLSVYQKGVDPSLRKVVWKHILNVYPKGLSAEERLSYMKHLSAEYQKLRQAWQEIIILENETDEIKYVIHLVRIDVLRTDRNHAFYAGSDNKNVLALINVLTTYALNHPSVSYCQGMSDLASPILAALKDEAQAYVCFCALMQRLKPNFLFDGKAMTSNFQQLTKLLQYYDPRFFEYLKSHGAEDLLFCYRWLLLELKREFAFDDALLMLEVLWSSIPPKPPEKGILLWEDQFAFSTFHLPSPLIHAHRNLYTKVQTAGKDNSVSSIHVLLNTDGNTEIDGKHNSDSYDDHNILNYSIYQENSDFCTNHCVSCSNVEYPQGYLPMTAYFQPSEKCQNDFDNVHKSDEVTGSIVKKSISFKNDNNCSPIKQTKYSNYLSLSNHTNNPVCNTTVENLDLYSQCKTGQDKSNNVEILQSEKSNDTIVGGCSLKSDISVHSVNSHVKKNYLQSQNGNNSSISSYLPVRNDDKKKRFKLDSTGNEGVSLENKLDVTPAQEENQKQCEHNEYTHVNNLECDVKNKKSSLPLPYELGGGNPFMLFLCLTLLLQQRDIIMKNRMDYNELAMHFDKMVRKHNVNRVLYQARSLFQEYLQSSCQEPDSNPCV